MKKIVIFASGSGSNAERIYEYFAQNDLIEIALILTNNPQAGVLERAKRLAVPSIVFDRKTLYKTDFIQVLLQHINPNLIILAGFLWKFPDKIISDFPNKIINIHPSLLPKYGGKGMYGMHVHRAVISDKQKQSGITIHYVNEHYDQGEVIHQATTDVFSNDTPESLAQRIHNLEYEFFPKIIQKLLQ
ncbi:phosphoribosylglycinamide formyltransferase [Capnocytophaga catalasegens]|uniref:Phosphoribosylglycinamide formyltransferase n=1 Tax=Capnocytophaga catalasegens TaxID=1004260 RepID=A0AAV5AZQ2_9FLAO|nr:phosphoribosylglycinamide formyltransferase [Capnocytophaga catalasegens]GIZ15950.1 phosphoribosylglycinamide formyltransferase [Capnocytophaga catalasegens]GJM50437.1 phosphoribosylglycinamide formyltransferase [Capnocytophaga catalasegens]GJM53932.1 phosphoribosylglycinamide formyltransferase [Capnocytophaga catalasegens]